MSDVKYPRLFFFEDEVRIEFTKESYSLDYDNKRDLLKKIFSSVKSGKLTFQQAKDLIEDLDQHIDPPFVPKKDLLELDEGLHFIKGLTSQIMKLAFAKTENDFLNIPDKDPTEEGAFFELCPCGKPHGRLYTQSGMVFEVSHSKEIALDYLGGLSSNGFVNAEEIANCKMQIANSDLP